jgi:hypothetical protein
MLKLAKFTHTATEQSVAQLWDELMFLIHLGWWGAGWEFWHNFSPYSGTRKQTFPKEIVLLALYIHILAEYGSGRRIVPLLMYLIES